MLLNVGSGGGAAPAASAAAGGAAAGGDAAPEAAKEEEKEEGRHNDLTSLSPIGVTDTLNREGGIRRGYGFRSLRLSKFNLAPNLPFHANILRLSSMFLRSRCSKEPTWHGLAMRWTM